MEEKPFKTLDEQIAILKSRGMYISDVAKAKEYLGDYTYYSVINGYSDLFWDSPSRSSYKKGTSFGEIKALHHFDESLRRTLTTYILEIESIVKSQIVYHFCNDKDSNSNYIHAPEDYLLASSFDQDRAERVDDLIKRLKNIIKEAKKHNSAIKHYSAKYNSIPLWVLATQMSFGETVLFYHCLLPSERNAVARRFGIRENELESFLRVLKDFRNSIAHSNRVYCFKTVHRITSLVNNDGTSDKIEIRANTRFGSILFILCHLLSQKEFKHVCNTISTLFKGLSHKLNTITSSDVCSKMGIPKSMRERYSISIVDEGNLSES